VDNGIDGFSADMLLTLLCCLIKRSGGAIHVPVEEIEALNAVGLDTTMSPDGITMSLVDPTGKATVQ
jgi:hypothetical protein